MSKPEMLYAVRLTLPNADGSLKVIDRLLTADQIRKLYAAGARVGCGILELLPLPEEAELP